MNSQSRHFSVVLLIVVATVSSIQGFVMLLVPRRGTPFSSPGRVSPHIISLSSTSSTSTANEDHLNNELVKLLTQVVTLEKPLGMILEQNENDDSSSSSSPVYVAEITGTGSMSRYNPSLLEATLVAVNEEKITSLEQAMELIQNSGGEDSALVTLEFRKASLPVGTPVTLKAVVQGETTTIQAKVGDNLRNTLLENDIPVYQGLKQTLGNCGGGGQCTFCAFDVLEGGVFWGQRSEYEDKKLAKLGPNARLTCLNNILGPATLQKTQR